MNAFRHPIASAARYQAVPPFAPGLSATSALNALPPAAAETMRELQRMAAIGEFAVEIAHEFNNVLQLIVASSMFVQPQVAENDIRQSDLKRIADATTRGARLVEQLIRFRRRQKSNVTMLNLHELLVAEASLIEPLFARRIEVVVAPSPPAEPSVFADPGALEQVVLNLCITARDAMPRGGMIALGCRFEDIDGVSSNADSRRMPGRYVVLSVADCGSGIPEPILRRMFERGFTAKSGGKGAGIGLHVVANIAAAHQGFVEVESKPGVGTRFDVYLPAVLDRQAS